MNTRDDLEQMKRKPMPKGQRGKMVKLGENIVKPVVQATAVQATAVQEAAVQATAVQATAVQEADESATVPVQILDSRATKGAHINRAHVLERMSTHGILRVHASKPVQEPPTTILEESSLQTPLNVPKTKKLGVAKVVIGSTAAEEDDIMEEDFPILKSKIEPALQEEATEDVMTNPTIAAAPTVADPVTTAPRKTKKIRVLENAPLIIPNMETATIAGHLVKARLPPSVAPEKLIHHASAYYLNNRRRFVQKLADLLAPYRKVLAEQEDQEITCSTHTSDANFELLTHQQIVRDYLNLYSPYRGLLLYHGLGSGKTCTSIAIAEGMKSERRVFVLTPASLKTNFFSELKKCGDSMYKRNQFWEFVSTEGKPEHLGILAKALSLPIDLIKSNRGAWMIDVQKEPNYDVLPTDDQRAIDTQLNFMIRAKYTDINYNGLNQKKMELLTGGFTKNPFDNAVVLIDEAHNFVSRIVNKVKSPKSLSYMLYDYLMSASNARIVLMSGTPIINYPNELGILFNILRGYIRTWTFPVRLKGGHGKLTEENILEWFDQAGFRTFDYLEFSGDKLTITRNPFGFVNAKKPGPTKQKGGMEALAKVVGGRKTKRSVSVAKHRQTKKNKIVVAAPIQIKEGLVNIKHLDQEEEPIGSELSELRRQHIGYNGEDFHPYKGGQNTLTTYEGGQNTLTTYEGGQNTLTTYEGGQNTLTTYNGGEGAFEKYNGVRLDQTGNLSDTDFVQTVIKVLGKHGVEVITGNIHVDDHKALPDDTKAFLELFIDAETGTMKNVDLFKRRILGLSSYFRSAQEQLLPKFVLNPEGGIFHIVRTEMSEYQFQVYERIRREEITRESSVRKRQAKQSQKAGAETFEISSSYRIFSRASCNFAFPDPPGRPRPERDQDESAIDGLTAKERVSVDDYMDEEDADELESTEGDKPIEYQRRIQRALELLKYNEDKPREQEYLTEAALAQYSPKFIQLLNRLHDRENTGLHLVYSQFRTLEGVGILKLILEANGFAEFKLIRSADGSWSIGQQQKQQAGKPRFVLYTGTETAEEKEIIRNIYNSKWSDVPASIVNTLRAAGIENNINGDAIRIMMITASGAEGINLKNTRFVHIVEPYWHMVRLEQVIGRARRICSHEDLPEDQRTVKVFLYVSTFTEKQRKDLSAPAVFTEGAKQTKVALDVSKVDPKRPITTDEVLLENAEIKNDINQELLRSIKETAIDCSLYNKNSSENLVCYGYGKVDSNRFGSYPTLERDRAEKADINQDFQLTKYKKITVAGRDFGRDEATNLLYDYIEAKTAKKTGVTLVPVGKLVKEKGRWKIEPV
jgi:hypothetical protein